MATKSLCGTNDDYDLIRESNIADFYTETWSGSHLHVQGVTKTDSKLYKRKWEYGDGDTVTPLSLSCMFIISY